MSSPRVLLGLLTTAALALAPLPAQAASVTTRDAARDVVSQAGDQGPTRPEPLRAEGDVLSMRVTHGTRAVRIRLQTSQLTRDPQQTTAHVFALKTNEGRRADLSIYVDGSRWQGQRWFTLNGRDRSCRGLRTHIDYRAGMVTAVVPRRCLSNPRWVRVGGGIGVDSDSRLYADDVSRDGTIGHELALGPRVRRN